MLDSPILLILVLDHQLRLFQHLDVLGNARQGDSVRFGDFVDRAFPSGKLLENGPSRGIRQGHQYRVQGIRFIINHVVEYMISPEISQPIG